MSVDEIDKKINWYYYSKMAIVYGLILFMVVFISGVIVQIINPTIGSAVLVCVGFVVMIIFIIAGAAFPIGKYNIRKYIDKKDIEHILEYMKNYKDSDDKYYDALLIIFRTVREMIHDYGVMNWATEDVQNNAWNFLFNYLNVTHIWKLNPVNVKKFAKELSDDIVINKINAEVLIEIEKDKFVNESVGKKILLKWRNAPVAVTCLIALILLIIFKMVVFFVPALQVDFVNLINQIGADIIAVFLAIITVRTELSIK